MTTNHVDQLRTRIDNLCNSTRWATAFADGIERHRSVVSNWFSHAPEASKLEPPAYLEAIVELLEITPVKKWPERWNRLAELKIKQANMTRQSA